MRNEYLRSVKIELISKPNGGKSISAINTWLEFLRYSIDFLNWTIEELRNIDCKSRKTLSIYKSLHLRDSAMLYLQWKEIERGLRSIED